ncbi:protein YgfX [Noviherbaspirillum saxi]
MIGAMSLVVASIGIGVVIGLIGVLPFMPKWISASAILFLSFFGFYHGTKRRKPIQLDISGAGQFRLTEVASFAPCSTRNRPHVITNGEEFKLLGDSTLSPHLMVLRLQAEDKRIITVLILPDSVSRDTFRAVSVACRWIAMNGKPLNANGE